MIRRIKREDNMSVNIAIDGPAGAGKSTIAKKVAKALGFIYVDTGAMYRAMAYYFIKYNVSSEDVMAIEEHCKNIDITIEYVKEEQQVLLNGENISRFLRTEEVGNMASSTSVYPKVRQKLMDLQKKLAESSNVIMDGRDIGTCVLPNAQVKIFLTASVTTRAQRRFEELSAKGMNCNLSEIEEDIRQRDHRDMTREIAPLKQAEDAILIDSSTMNIDQVTEEIIQIYKRKCEE